MSLPGGQDVIIGNIVLKHQIHTLDIVTSMSPITFGINVTKVKAFVKSLTNPRHSNGNLPGDKGGSTTGRLVVEKNAVSEVHSIGLTVVDQDPEGVLLGDSVGRTGIEGGGFGLGYFLDFSVKLGGGSLVEAGGFLEATGADGVKHAKDTNSITVSSVLQVETKERE